MSRCPNPFVLVGWFPMAPSRDVSAQMLIFVFLARAPRLRLLRLRRGSRSRHSSRSRFVSYVFYMVPDAVTFLTPLGNLCVEVVVASIPMCFTWYLVLLPLGHLWVTCA